MKLGITSSWKTPYAGYPGRSDRLGKTIESRRIVDENAFAGRLVWRPRGKQIEEHCVIGHLLLAAMRPVAAPHHAVGRGLGISLSHFGRVRIGRRPTGRIQVGT